MRKALRARPEAKTFRKNPNQFRFDDHGLTLLAVGRSRCWLIRMKPAPDLWRPGAKGLSHEGYALFTGKREREENSSVRIEQEAKREFVLVPRMD